MSDSLKDVEDLSLRFSVEGEFKFNGELDDAMRQKELVEAITKRMVSSNYNDSASYYPGRRQGLFVIATDCYNSNGEYTETLQSTIKNVMQTGSALGLGRIGYVFLTGSSLRETMEALKCCQVSLEEFDALVCNSGSELYYPWRDRAADTDYESHIEYRWPGENVRSTVTRLARLEGGNEDDIMEHVGAWSSRCCSYSVKSTANVRIQICFSVP